MNGNNIPKWKLEWYLAGALPPEEAEAIAAAERGGDKELRGRIEALRASNTEILAKYPPPVMVKKTCAARTAVQNKNLSMRYSRGRFQKWTIPALACAALLIAIPVHTVLTERTENNSKPFSTTRVKGEANGETPPASIEVWRKAGDSAEQLAPEAAVNAGDIVQLRYTVPNPCYGALVSMDGRGVLTVHLSGNGGRAALLTHGHPIALNTSYKLDDAPAFETFYLITADDEFSLEAVKRRLMNAKRPVDGGPNLSLPQKQIAAFTLRKSDGKGIN